MNRVWNPETLQYEDDIDETVFLQTDKEEEEPDKLKIKASGSIARTLASALLRKTKKKGKPDV